VYPQTELKEVLGVDEEAGPLDGGEVESPDLSEEEKGLENTEPPMQTDLLMASVPVAQVGPGGGPCVPLMSLHELTHSMACTLVSLK
jgi:hypothetical protein